MLRALEAAKVHDPDGFSEYESNIGAAFIWSASPQGHAYWAAIERIISASVAREREARRIAERQPTQAPPAAEPAPTKSKAKKSDVVRIPAG